MARVFLSHASEDNTLAESVRDWFRDDGHEVFLDADPHTGIAPGERWKDRLYERLRWADALVCLVTPAYNASRWCFAEVVAAQALGCRIVPLSAEPGLRHDLLSEVQHLACGLDGAGRDEACALVREIGVSGGAGWADGRSPFPGLRPFDVDMHKAFFGRASEVDGLVRLLRSAAERGDRRLVMVVGPSGCGKSSLARAGLLPKMETERGWATLPPVLPGRDPVATLAAELAAAAPAAASWTPTRLRERLEDDQGGLVRVVEDILAAQRPVARRLLVVVDQFEEVLAWPASERRRFAEVLRPAVDGGQVQVVGTMRSESLDALLTCPEFADMPVLDVPLRPIDGPMLPTVIEEPAKLARLDIDPELVGRIVADTASGEALPLLAFTLQQLALDMPPGARLTAERYDQLGGVQGALLKQADVALAAATAATGNTRADVVATLLRLVNVDEAGAPTRREIDHGELAGASRTDVDAFKTQRLLTTRDTGDGVLVGVAHEAFLRAWPPLAEAIRSHETALRMRRAVEQAAAEWHHNGHVEHYLWDADRLRATLTTLKLPAAPEDATRALAAEATDLGTGGRRFLLACVDRAQAARRRERRRRTRTVSVLSALLALALVLATIATLLAADQRQQAETARQTAAAVRLATSADAVRDSDRRLALQLGVVALDLSPDEDTAASAASSLFQTLTTPHLLGAPLSHLDSVESAAFSPDGRTLATGGDKAARLWDVADPARSRPLGEPLADNAHSVRSVAFSPDGRTLATSDGWTVRLWDVADPARPRPLGGPLQHTDSVESAAFSVESVAFSPDGHILATGGGEFGRGGAVRLWDVADPARPQPLGVPLGGHANSVSSMAFSPDGATLATATGWDAARLWDVADPAHPRPLGEPLDDNAYSVWSVAFSPDGATLATGSGFLPNSGTSYGTARLWDVADPARPSPWGAPLAGHNYPVESVVFSSDSRTLATGGSDGVRLWDVADSTQPRLLGAPLPTGGSSVVFSPDGHTLATGGSDGTVRLWDVAAPTQARPLAEPLDTVGRGFSVAFSPDGHTLATGGGATRLWDVADPTHPRPLSEPLDDTTAVVRSVVFSPHGHTLATGNSQGVVHLWDVADPTQPRPLGEPLQHGKNPTEHPVFSMMFSPDGRTLATGSIEALATGGDAGAVRLWDVADPAHPRPLGEPLDDATGGVSSVAFSPDGHTLATSDGGTVRLRDVTYRTRPRPRLLGAPLPTGGSSVVFSPDGHTLATSDGGTVRLWDVADPARPRPLGAPLGGHTRGVWSVVYSLDGRILASGSSDGTARLWDVTYPAHPWPLGVPLGGSSGTNVRKVAFSPKGATLATANDYGGAQLWDVTETVELRDNLATHACDQAGAGLDQQAWAYYVPNAPYREMCPA